MIVVPCFTCAFVIRVMPVRMGDATSEAEVDHLVGRSSDFWPAQFHCVRCGKPCRGMRESEADPRALSLMTLQDLTPQEAFAAFNGLGLPDEQKCSLEVVQVLLREQPIRRVVGRSIQGVERTLVDALELWDGSTVYFGAGGDGAVIYRITRPISYTRTALGDAG